MIDPRDRVIDRLPPNFDPTETGVMEKFAPGMSWVPRWFRKHLTPHMVVGAIVVIFSAGTLWANLRTSAAIADVKRDVATQKDSLEDFKQTTGAKLTSIDTHSSKVDVLQKGQEDLERRVSDIEDDYKWAQREAGTPTPRRRK